MCKKNYNSYFQEKLQFVFPDPLVLSVLEICFSRLVLIKKLLFSLGNRKKSVEVRPSGKIGPGTAEVVYV